MLLQISLPTQHYTALAIVAGVAIHTDPGRIQQLLTDKHEWQIRTFPGRYIKYLKMVFQTFGRTIESQSQFFAAAARDDGQGLLAQPLGSDTIAIACCLHMQGAAKRGKMHAGSTVPDEWLRPQIFIGRRSSRRQKYAFAITPDMTGRMRNA